MFRTLLLCGAALVGLGSTGGGASAQIPEPDESHVPDHVTITPDGAFEYAVQIIRYGAPVADVSVVIRFSATATRLIAWSDGAGDVPSHPETEAEPYREYTRVTDANGEAGFHIAGGGCIEISDFPSPIYIAQVRAGGVILMEPQVNSPDAVDDGGRLCTDLGTCIEQGGFTSVSASDAAYHAPSVKQGLVNPCSDFTEPFGDAITAADATVLAAYVKDAIGSAAHCGP